MWKVSEVAPLRAMLAMVRRDLALALHRRVEALNPLVFFALVCALFPLGIGPESERLATLAPGILWVVALLSGLLASDGIFRRDHDDGCLEQMLLSPVSLYLQTLARALAHWLVTGLPLALVSPLLALLLALPAQAMPALVLSLLLGTMVLSLVGTIGAALTVALRRGGLLLALVILPLYVPVLIFGSGCVEAAVRGVPYAGLLAVLGALAAAAITLAPLAAAAALRISVDT